MPFYWLVDHILNPRWLLRPTQMKPNLSLIIILVLYFNEIHYHLKWDCHFYPDMMNCLTYQEFASSPDTKKLLHQILGNLSWVPFWGNMHWHLVTTKTIVGESEFQWNGSITMIPNKYSFLIINDTFFLC